MIVEVGWSIAFTINIIINHAKASGIRLQPIQNDVHTFLGVALADAGRRGYRQLNSGPIGGWVLRSDRRTQNRRRALSTQLAWKKNGQNMATCGSDGPIHQPGQQIQQVWSPVPGSMHTS